MWIDLHSHLLPGMDDGSKSVEQSLEILSASWAQGIRVMAATSHFYPSENSPEQYLERREHSLQKLAGSLEPDMPVLLPGAEVYYFEGISSAKGIDALKITGTPLLLLEMPFGPWTDRMIGDIMALADQPGMRVLLAHIERYMRWQKKYVWDDLRDYGVLMQSNAEFFLTWQTKRKAIRMLRDGKIHFIASDTHNTSSRPQRLGEALKVIGEEGRKILLKNIARYLPMLEDFAAPPAM